MKNLLWYKYALLYQRAFVDNLALNANTLMNDRYEYEKEIEWSGYTYLSPIYIFNKLINNDDRSILAYPTGFLQGTFPGSHRG